MHQNQMNNVDYHRKHNKLLNYLDLIQYRDTIQIPLGTTLLNKDIFSNVSASPPAWIPPDPSEPDKTQSIHYQSLAISPMVDSFDVLEHHRSIMSLTGEVAFFGTRYKRLDPSTNQYKSILIQAHNLKSQVFHYDTTLDNCSDSTTAIYVSSRHTDLP